jgi:cobalt-zinc-cadmium efflux system protein
LAALANAMLLLVAIGAIGWEAAHRLLAPEPVNGTVVIALASLGIVINTATALLFFSGKNDDVNIRGAYLHMAADAAVSLGVVVAGVLIMYTGWSWLDPTVSIAICAVIFAGSWQLLRESVNLAVDAVPSGIEPGEVQAYLESLPGVSAVHDLHIWALSTTKTALTVHLVRPDSAVDDAFLFDVARQLKERFRIAHSTIQIEHGSSGTECHLAPEHVV